MPYFYYGSSYLLYVLPAIIICALAQWNVSAAFQKYSKVGNARRFTGYSIARAILDQNGLYDVRIEHVPGRLTDHFDPTAGVVRLSDAVYHSESVAAIGVAAHEVGHVLQYQQAYFPIRIRKAILPITQIGNAAAWPLAILGIFLGIDPLVNFGILLFTAVVLFQLLTLPVEFNASARALRTLRDQQVLEGAELAGAKRMLQAAALTYVGALIMAIANLLRLLALSNRNRR